MEAKKLNSLNKHQEAIYDDLRFMLKSMGDAGGVIMLDKLVDSITASYDDTIARLEAIMDEKKEEGTICDPPDMYENTEEENNMWRSGYVQGLEDALYFIA